MTALRTWGAVTSAAVMAGSLAACGGSSKAAQSAVSLSPTSSATHAVSSSTSPASSTSSSTTSASVTPSSTTHSQVPAATSATSSSNTTKPPATRTSHSAAAKAVPVPTKTNAQVNPNSVTLGLVGMGLGTPDPAEEGYGSAHPAAVLSGGDGSTGVQQIKWSNWGSPMATGTGMAMDPYADPNLPIAAQPLAPIKVAAYGLTTCHGHLAYSHFVQYFAQHGETLKSMMAKESAAKSLCG